jgi:D-lyxose ketol-isomerase
VKRSEINRIMRKAIAFLQERKFHLPPFAFWAPDEWKTKGHEADEIRNNHLGWDVTDFGSGQFEEVGLFLFTLRNGDPADPNASKTYCEKVMIVREGQTTPMHFHWSKAEDIINRGGGNLLIELWNATEDEAGLAQTPVVVAMDGLERRFEAGEVVRLTPGESVTLGPRLYHKFWGEPGQGTVLVGEVSKVNDDATDNRFYAPVGRFPEVEEDEPPLHLLCTEYPAAP